jgi:hypothetical protein
MIVMNVKEYGVTILDNLEIQSEDIVTKQFIEFLRDEFVETIGPEIPRPPRLFADYLVDQFGARLVLDVVPTTPEPDPNGVDQ